MIIQQLEQFRIKQNLTNEELAEMLGIHTVSLYRNKRTGKFNAKFLLNAQKILSNNVPKGDKDVMPKRHQPPQNGQEGGLRGKVVAMVKRIFSRSLRAGIFHLFSPFRQG